MFKLVVLSALVAVAMAAPSGIIAAPAAVAYSSPLVAHSAVVGSVPTSVSSHSSTVVHSHAVHTAAVAAPIAVAHAAPIAVAQPWAAPIAVAHAAPVLAARTVVAGPVASSISHGLLNGHVATAPIGHVASPLIATGVHAW